MLNLSVGSVQQMASNGILQATLTTGGHRRICKDSMEEYCRRTGRKIPDQQMISTPNPGKMSDRVIFIIHNNQQEDNHIFNLDDSTEARFSKTPLALLDQEKRIECIFIDSKCEWLQKSTLDAMYGFLKKHRTYIYNWEEPKYKELDLDNFPKIKTLNTNVNIDIISFYLLGMDSALK